MICNLLYKFIMFTIRSENSACLPYWFRETIQPENTADAVPVSFVIKTVTFQNAI